MGGVKELTKLKVKDILVGQVWPRAMALPESDAEVAACRCRRGVSQHPGAMQTTRGVWAGTLLKSRHR